MNETFAKWIALAGVLAVLFLLAQPTILKFIRAIQ